MTSILERLLPAAGQVVAGRYRIRDELGRGGFGIVYSATQLALDEDVAIKVLLPHLLENQHVAGRFEREVAVAKGLRHPNSIRILDFGETEQGLPFFAMELIRGQALDDVIDRHGPMSPSRARRIVTQVLKSLAEAHSQGVVHRDLKPGNIFLTQIVGEDDFVKVLDFGIAKALTGDDGGVYTTNTGVVLGTPAYMSPEQALGVRDLDGRSDLYAVGLILAECLTGAPIVQGVTPYLMVAQHASGDPLALPPVVSDSPLGPVVAQATAKDRTQRYSSATEMRLALEALGPLSDEVDSDPTEPPAPRQPPPSLPHVTPVSLVEQGPPADPSAMTVLAAPLARNPTLEPEPVPARSHRATWMALLVITLAVATAAVVVLTHRPGPGAERVAGSGNRLANASPARPSPHALVDAGTPQAPVAEPPVATLTDAGSADAESADAGSGPAASIPNPAALEHRFYVRTAMAVAHERLVAAVPTSRPVHFAGDDVTIRLGDQQFGPTPVDLWLPQVDARIELGFERAGYRSEVREVSLLDDVVTVELQRQAHADHGSSGPSAHGEAPSEQGGTTGHEHTGTDHTEEGPGEPAQSGPGLPFGQTPIHD